MTTSPFPFSAMRSVAAESSERPEQWWTCLKISPALFLDSRSLIGGHVGNQALLVRGDLRFTRGHADVHEEAVDF